MSRVTGRVKGTVVRAAVVGGGVFGATAAVQFAKAGYEVDLYERHADLLLGATRANQARLHHGYHYPRTPNADLRSHADRFARRFPTAIVRDHRHYYCVARERSHLTGTQYLDFCDRIRLPYELDVPPMVRRESVDVCMRVPEAFIDVPTLRDVLRRDLVRYRVRTRFGASVEAPELDGYDWVINATYGRQNGRPLQFEVCETAIVRLGRHMRATSFVVMDGPFISLDPVPRQDCHILYDVTHSVHSVNVGSAPEIPDALAPLLDRGPVRTPLTRVDAMLHTARQFLHGLDKVEYCSSYFTVRAVLPDVEGTDARPTLVQRDGRHISILSGKVDMAVWAAERAVELVDEASLTGRVATH
jgi:glycine/D-amino acid oxidase-like deaminating enzyme